MSEVKRKQALISRTIGSVEYAYTKEQLSSLKKHVDSQKELNVALRFFFSEEGLEPDYLEVLEHWLRIAEEMKRNSNWIEDHQKFTDECEIYRQARINNK